MSAKTIIELPLLNTAKLTDYVMIQHQDSSGVWSTYKITVKDLLLAGTVKASDSTVVWDQEQNTLQVTAKNLRPNFLLKLDDSFYPMQSYSYVDNYGTATIYIEAGLGVGEHKLRIKNGLDTHIHKFVIEDTTGDNPDDTPDNPDNPDNPDGFDFDTPDDPDNA